MRNHWTRVVETALIAILPNVPGDVFPHAATSNTVLFDREIVRLLNGHCVMCHAEGAASFPLETYEQVWLARREIHDAILAKQMPPWPAVPGYGDFVNANGLTLRETRFIVSWVEGLGPRNDGEVFLNVLGGGSGQTTEIRAVADFATWRIGAPDVVLALPPAQDVAERADDLREGGAADGGLRIVRSIVATGLDRATPIRALEYHPDDREPLHAVELSVESTGQWLATWTPWHGLRELPDAAAITLPAEARIVARAYVAGTAADFDAAGELGLVLADGAAAEVTDLVLETQGLATASGARERLEASTVLGDETTVLGLWPVLPGGAESLEVRARAPDGGISILLAALAIPLDWPTAYLLEEPARLAAGSELEFIVYRAATSGSSAAPRLVLSVY